MSKAINKRFEEYGISFKENSYDRGNINREIKYQNKILKEIAIRIKVLLNWKRRKSRK